MSAAIQIRRATIADSKFVLKVRNEKSVREVSFHSDLISEANHKKWFSRLLAEKNSRLFVIKNEQSKLIGTLRFDRLKNDTAEIHIAILPQWRNHGVGFCAVNLGLGQIEKNKGWHVDKVIAQIRTENRGSVRFFQKVGFKPYCTSEYRDKVILRWQRKCFLFVIDAGSQIGMGHIMRALCLIKEIRSMGHKALLCTRRIQGIKKTLLRQLLTRHSLTGSELIASRTELQHLLFQGQINCVIIDTLDFKQLNTFRKFAEQGIPIVAIGNYARVPSWISLCVNPYSNSRFDSKHTIRKMDSSFYIVSDYFRQLKAMRNGQVHNRKIKQILILAGGGNTGGMIFQILSALQDVPISCHIHVVVGRFFTLDEQLKTKLSYLGCPANVWKNIPSTSVAKLMKTSDLAILSYGRSLDEARCLGLPAIVLSSSKLNHFGALHAQKQGGMIYLGDFRTLKQQKLRKTVFNLLANKRKWAELSRKARSLVDGLGVERVANLVSEMAR